LHVGELEAEDVGHDQDGILRAAVFGVDFVRTNWVGWSEWLQCGGVWMYSLSPKVLISPFGVPSCLTPIAQHFCAG
jgi:hypothetical protein